MKESSNNIKHYLLASDFDQTLSFNDSGLVLSELLGISEERFQTKIAALSRSNLVQQGGELAYLLLHDPEYRFIVRKEHLIETGKRIRLKQNIGPLCRVIENGIDGYRFSFYVISAAPEEVIHSALENVIPPDHIYGSRFRYDSTGQIDSIIQVTAGYGKVAAVEQLLSILQISNDRIVYVGDGRSDIHVMLHINHRDGFTIAVSEAKHIAQIAKRTILCDDALSVLIPILEELVGWDPPRIRVLFESHGFLIQEWDKVQTDWLSIRHSSAVAAPDVEPLLEVEHV